MTEFRHDKATGIPLPVDDDGGKKNPSVIETIISAIGVFAMLLLITIAIGAVLGLVFGVGVESFEASWDWVRDGLNWGH